MLWRNQNTQRHKDNTFSGISQNVVLAPVRCDPQKIKSARNLRGICEEFAKELRRKHRVIPPRFSPVRHLFVVCFSRLSHGFPSGFARSSCKSHSGNGGQLPNSTNGHSSKAKSQLPKSTISQSSIGSGSHGSGKVGPPAWWGWFSFFVSSLFPRCSLRISPCSETPCFCPLSLDLRASSAIIGKHLLFARIRPVVAFCSRSPYLSPKTP